MDVLTRQEEIDGKWFAWILTEGLNTMMIEVDHELTEEEAKQKQADWLASRPEVIPDGATE